MDRGGRRAATLLLLPALLVVGIFLAALIGLLLRVALFPPGPLAPLSGGPELDSFASLAGDPYPAIALRTARLSLLTTLFAVLLGFPAALLLSRSRGSARTAQTLLVLSPLLLSAVVPAYGWMLVLGPHGLAAGGLAALGLSGASLLATEAGVVLALTGSFLPFMVLALAASLDRIDAGLVEAARGLGASPAQVFGRIVLPLVRPGLAAGAGFVTVGSLSAYAAPALVGGPEAPTLVTEIYRLVAVRFDWPTAAAVSLALLFVSAAIVGAAARFARRPAGVPG